MAKAHRNSLKPGHRVHWYEIVHVLGQGGFGITYLALDTNLKQQVAIKEYLPIELAVRERDESVHPVSEDRTSGFTWGLGKFIAEAQTLAQFSHPNIVHVYTVFEANNTAYMVMRYEQGESLQAVLTRRKTLEEEELFRILIPVVGGLSLVHEAGFIHRDIKPANIFIRADRSPVLLDFGSARQALGGRTTTLTSLVSPGYAPFEQYYSRGDEQGPWTDIYGLGATLYRAITGVTPIDAIDRSKSIVEGSREHFVTVTEIGQKRYSKRFLRAVDHALAFRSGDRPQNLGAWLSEFEVPPAIAADAAVVIPGRVPSAARHRWVLPLLAAAVVVGMLAVAAQRSGIEPDWRTAIDRMASTFSDLRPVPAEDLTVERQATLERGAQAAREQRAVALAALMDEAERLVAENKLLEPPDENALERYDAVLTEEPGHPGALAGRRRLLDHFLSSAANLIGTGSYDEADGALLRAAVVDPDSTELRLLRVRLKDAEAQAARRATAEIEVREAAEAERQAVLEAERSERERQALEAKRLRLEEEQRRVAEEDRRREEARLAAIEQERIAQEAAARAEEEKRVRFQGLIASADAARAARDKEAAIEGYQAALALYPADPRASTGILEAERLLEKVCYEVLGRWEYKRLFGKDTMNVKEGGSIDYHSTVSGGGNWECADPGSRTFRITVTAAGFSNTWNARLSADGRCLDAAHGGCFVRP